MHDKLSFLGADLLKDTLPSIINGTNESIPQDGTQATFASNISRKTSELIGIKVHKPSTIIFVDYHHGQWLIRRWTIKILNFMQLT